MEGDTPTVVAATERLVPVSPSTCKRCSRVGTLMARAMARIFLKGSISITTAIETSASIARVYVGLSEAPAHFDS